MNHLEANSVYRNRPDNSWVVINHETRLVVRTFRVSKSFPKFTRTMPPGYTCLRVYLARRNGWIPAAEEVAA